MAKGVQNKAFEGSSLDVLELADSVSSPLKKRPTWGNSLEFLMSCISVSVGLGNIWRFPFTAYENGGGAFLIPYITVLFLIGKPLYYLEMALGQFRSRGSVLSLQAIPALRGVGVAQQIGTACVLTYYCSLIALTLIYMIKSFSTELPWTKCDPQWSDVVCINSSAGNSNKIPGAISSSELYFTRKIMKQDEDLINGIGLPDLELTCWLLLAWICVFLVIIKGVKSSGKVAYFLAIFPYIVLLTLLVRAVTLEGSWDGIKFFITPDFGKLLEPQVWYFATTQLFFSLSVGMGSIIMFSRDAMIVTTLDTFTSLLGGFTIFAILGNLAHNLGEKDISKVVKNGGQSLAFISYPEAISKFKFVPQLFSVLFFFMLFVLGIGSAVGLLSSIVTNFTDAFPKIKYWKIAGITSLLGFLIGLVYVTPQGTWMLGLVDHFGGTFLIFALAILEIVGIFWIYGLQNFCIDMEFMLGRKVTPFWRITWSVVTPVMMLVIFIYTMAKLENPTYSDKKAYPMSSLIAGWMIFIVGISQIIIWVIWLAYRKDFDGNSRLMSLFRPDADFGPDDAGIRAKWIVYKSEMMERYREKTFGHSKFKIFIGNLMGKY